MKGRRFLQAGASLVVSSLFQGCEMPDQKAFSQDLVPGRFLPTGVILRDGWDRFLEQWEAEAMEIVQGAGLDGTEALVRFARNGTLGKQGARPAKIEAREQALGVTFPESFYDFLLVTDGWLSLSRPESATIEPMAQIDWLRVVNPSVIRAWREPARGSELGSRYSEYGSGQDPVYFRTSHLNHCLALSSTTDDAPTYLLNTAVTSPGGEMEAWDLDYQLPGAYRYQSFAELMEVLHQEEIDFLRYQAGSSTQADTLGSP